MLSSGTLSQVVTPWAERWAEGAVETIHAVYEEYGFTWEPEGYHADLYDVRGQYLAEGHRFWVYVEDDRVLGTAALEGYSTLAGRLGETVSFGGKTRVAATDGSVERLYVHPDARRREIATKLMATVVQTARSEGRRALEVWSDKRFEAAHRLYEGMGARIVGERICDDPDVSPEWGLLLPI